MYAILKASGRQVKVQKDDTIVLNRLPKEEGEPVEFGEVLLVYTGKKYLIGTPYVPGAKVQAKVLRHLRGEKIEGFKYKPKKNYRRRWGHRQDLTELKIENIVFKE